MNSILITGASGLIGKKLISALLASGKTVHTLTRSSFKADKRVKQFLWDIPKNVIDPKCIQGVSTILHLAGAGVADKRWTTSRKKELWDSRTESTALLHDLLKKEKHQVTSLVSASAVGYYGDRGSKALTEKTGKGEGFLSDLCEAWENSAAQISNLGIRVATGRIGIVLAKEGGALPEMMNTVKLGVGGYFAKDPLFYPWIHIDDVVRAFIFLAENEKKHGVYNFTAPAPVSHKRLMTAAVKAKGQTPLLLPTPQFALKLVMGEMSDMLFNSQNCIPEKLEATGFEFIHTNINDAMSDLLGDSN